MKMFRKSNFFKKTSDCSESEPIKEEVTSKFTELSLSHVINEKALKPQVNCGILKLATKIDVPDIVSIKDKQIDFAKKLFLNSDSVNKKPGNVINNYPNVKRNLFGVKNKKILFPQKAKIDKNFGKSTVLSKYILPSNLEYLYLWMKYSTSEEPVDVEQLISSFASPPEIKKLVPNKFCLGKDIVPNYLQKKSKKQKPSDPNLKQINNFRSIVKAYKSHDPYKSDELNVTFMGSTKSGKSSLIGQLLVHLSVLDTIFIKNTESKARKSNSESSKFKWLLDTSIDERNFNETISFSSHFVEIEGNSVNLIDTPGNWSYFEQIITPLLMNNQAVVLVINMANDWCERTCQYRNIDYINNVFHLLKVFSICQLNFLFVNCQNRDITSPVSKLQSIWKRFSKLEASLPHIITINDLLSVKPQEIQSILDNIGACQRESPEPQLDQPVLLEVVDVFKPIESALPVVVGRVLRGGIAAGVNNSLSKGFVVPNNMGCTIKSMKVLEKDHLKMRSFAFPQNLVELTLPEINSEDKIKKGSFICHPENRLISGTDFVAQMRIFDCNIDIPIVNGIQVFLWSRSRRCCCTLTKMISVEYNSRKQKTIKKNPRLIQESGCTVTVQLKTHDLLSVEFNSLHKLDIFLLFSGSTLFAAGKFQDIIQ